VLSFVFFINTVLSFLMFHVQTAGLVVAVDDDGCFIEKISDFKGRYVKEADKDIINAVKAS
jgi:isoleucyl-tRNA synthetase